MLQSKHSKCDSHGGLVNDPLTMNSVLARVLGKRAGPLCTSASLKY